VDQFARPLALVAHGRQRWIEPLEVAETELAQHRAHGRARQAEPASDPIAGQALPAQSLDLRIAFADRAIAVSDGRRASIIKSDLAARPIPPQPLMGAPLRNASRQGGIGHLPPLLLNSPNHQESTLRRQAHSCECSSRDLRGCSCSVSQPQFSSPALDEQPS
jgi:hypothetical protein